MLTGLNATLAPESYEKPYKREYDIFVTIVYPIFPVLLLAGLITNTLNIVTFLKAGVKDSVATLLLTISISDAIFLCFFAPVALRRGFSSLGANKNRVLYEMFLILFWPAFTMYDFSAYTTIFLGVTRCACVAMPLKFKSVFTRKRTVISVIVLFCIDVLFHIPVLSIFTLKWKTDAQRNTTYLSVSFVGDRIDAAYKQTLNDIINKNTLQAVSITMIITCAALLSFKLYESSKVRSKPVQDPGSGEANPKTSHHLSPKDVRVVQSAILVCSIYIMAQLPSLIYTLLQKIIPEFSDRGRFSYLVGICISTTFICYLLNASVNIFVYYNYNSKYRSVFRSLFNLNNVSELKI